MSSKKKEVVNIDELDYGDKFVGESAKSPIYSSVFNQPATVNEKKIELAELQRSELHKFPDHPYRVIDNEKMMELRDSIIENGILQPIIVRPRLNGGYTILAGHRRCRAAELAQISSVPVLIMKNITDAQATIIMVESNRQREEVLPSEKAKAYKMEMEARNQQGYRTDLTSSPVGTKLRTDEIIAKEVGESRNQIHRYIRLNYLIPQLLDLVDNDVLKQKPSIAFRPAVELSYLQPDEQQYFYDTVKTLGKTPSVQQATQIKELSRAGELTQTRVLQILIEDKPNQKETVRVDCTRLRSYYNASLSPKEYESKVFECLDGMKKIRATVEKHIPKELSDDEIATLFENLLKDQIKKDRATRNVQVR